MPVGDGARRIAGAIESHRRELAMTAKGRPGLWLKHIAPGGVDNPARRALREDEPR